MLIRIFVTTTLALFGIYAFWSNALDAGYFTNPFGFLFLFFAVVSWFKWATIGRILYAADGDPIIGTASKVVGRMGFRRHDPFSHHSPSSTR